VGGGVGEHRLEQAPGLGLALGAGVQLLACRLQARGEVVTQHLELAQAQQTGAAAAGHGHVERVAGEGGHQRGGELALEPGDLVAQRPLRSVLRCPVGCEGRKLDYEVISKEDHG
jgi:hypothetical protein